MLNLTNNSDGGFDDNDKEKQLTKLQANRQFPFNFDEPLLVLLSDGDDDDNDDGDTSKQ